MTWTQILIALALYIVYIVIPRVNSTLARRGVAANCSLEFAYHYYFTKSRRVALYVVAFLFGWLMQTIELLVLIRIISSRHVADEEALDKIFKNDK